MITRVLLVVALSFVVEADISLLAQSKSSSLHSDEWCKSHHWGEGASACNLMSGCCFVDFDNACLSCNAHSAGWCAEHGTDLNTCIGLGGMCKWNIETGVCLAAVDEYSDEVNCLHAQVVALQKQADHENCIDISGEESCDYWYLPKCSDSEAWDALQSDGLQWFCVDENGHEIPTTRTSSSALIPDCAKQRLMFKGYQCPNAEQFSAGNGLVKGNLQHDPTDCAIVCNTDSDCSDGVWCCSNGCGRACLAPFIPFSDCELTEDLPLHVESSDPDALASRNAPHGHELTYSCAEGFDVIPLSEPQEVTVGCNHGKWDPFSLDCLQGCAKYSLPETAIDRDYVVKGHGRAHGSIRTVSCPKGYGALAGDPKVIMDGSETIRCLDGMWSPLTLACAVCYDAHESTWRDSNGRSCVFYSSNPALCANGEGAEGYCRVSCGSCRDAELEYKKRSRREDLNDVADPKHWQKRHVGTRKVSTHIETKAVERIVPI